MTERPILMNAAMVRAVLGGAKTQTRRVLKQATGPSLSVGIDDDQPGVAALSWLSGDGPGHDVHETVKRVPCPYGVPGDRLWVREAWAPTGDPGRALYRCDFPEGPLSIKFKPSIHMPRWASRISLEVTDVRVERLQDISEGDAQAEGTERRDPVWPIPACPERGTHRAGFEALWESINGPGSWDANPWLWVVEFRRADRADQA
jgi:hypothetical protein